MNTGCQRRVGDSWHRGVCGKQPVEMVGTERLCKKHATGKKSANSAAARRQKERVEQDAREAEWEHRTNIAAAVLGVTGRVYYSSISHKLTDDVVISLEDFERLAGQKTEGRLPER